MASLAPLAMLQRTHPWVVPARPPLLLAVGEQLADRLAEHGVAAECVPEPLSALRRLRDVLHDAVLAECDAGWPGGGVQLVGLLRGGEEAVTEEIHELRRRYARRMVAIAPPPGETQFFVSLALGETRLCDTRSVPFAEVVRRWL